MRSKSQKKIDDLRDAATKLTGIPEILDNEYKKVYFKRKNKHITCAQSNLFKSDKKIL